MNANEVIANRAIQLAGGVVGSKKPIHPNDDVNRGQSSNDTFPAVMHIATVGELDASPDAGARAAARRRSSARRSAFADVVMIGRTHLQDATPVTLGQVISGWVGAARRRARRASPARASGCCPLALGGTAVGTGLNAHPRVRRRRVAQAIARETGRAVRLGAATSSPLLSAHDAIVNVSAALRTLAGALMKIANDVRWHASGPRAGLGEITIPDNEPGSSIMPGKINPTQCEALTMVAVHVFGNDAAVAFAGSQGNFQLNVYKPVMLHGVLESIELLADAMRSFDERCARGIEPDCARIRANVERSLMLVTALNPHIGYENAAKIALAAHREGTTPARGRAEARPRQRRGLRPLGRSGGDDAARERCRSAVRSDRPARASHVDSDPRSVESRAAHGDASLRPARHRRRHQRRGHRARCRRPRPVGAAGRAGRPRRAHVVVEHQADPRRAALSRALRVPARRRGARRARGAAARRAAPHRAAGVRAAARAAPAAGLDDPRRSLPLRPPRRPDDAAELVRRRVSTARATAPA